MKADVPDAPGYAVNPYALLSAAASGDAEALRSLAREAARLWLEEGYDLAIVEGLVFARLAYARTGEDADGSLLLTLLAHASEAETNAEMKADLEGEMIAVLSGMADAGIANADAALVKLADAVGPDGLHAALSIHTRMLEAQGA